MSDLLLDTEVITWGRVGKEKSLTVRGLSSEDLTVAIRQHKESLTKMFAFVEGTITEASLPVLGAELLEQFPEVIALLITLAADLDRSEVVNVRRLPAPVQLKAMMVIYQLTVEDTGGLQDFLALVFGLLKKLNQGASWLSSRSVQENPNTGI